MEFISFSSDVILAEFNSWVAAVSFARIGESCWEQHNSKFFLVNLVTLPWTMMGGICGRTELIPRRISKLKHHVEVASEATI